MHKLYVGLISVAILILLGAGIIRYDNNFSWDGQNKEDNYVVYTTQACIFLLTILILILTICILRQYRINEKSSELHSNNQIMQALDQNQEIRIRRHQIKVLTIGLSMYSSWFWLFTIIAYTLVFPKDGFEWVEETFFRPLNNGSACILLILNLLAFSPSLLFWYVIFYVPYKYKKINAAIFAKYKLKIETQRTESSFERKMSNEAIEHLSLGMLNPTLVSSNISKSSIRISSPKSKFLTDDTPVYSEKSNEDTTNGNGSALETFESHLKNRVSSKNINSPARRTMRRTKKFTTFDT